MRTEQTIKNRYVVTDGVLAYTVTFPLYETTDVTVYLSTDGGTTETALTEGTQYSVTINDSGTGGTVTLVSGVASAGNVLVLLSSVPYTQELDLSNVSQIDVDATETQLDRTTQQIQQLKESLDRSVKLSSTSSKTYDEYMTEISKAHDESVSAASAAAGSATSAASSASAASETAASFDTTVAAKIAAVNTAGTTQVAAVNSAGDSQVSAIQSEGVTQKDAVTTAGETQVSNIATTGNEKLSTIASQGDAKISAITQEGATQIQAVKTEGATQTAAAKEQADAAAESATQAAASAASIDTSSFLTKTDAASTYESEANLVGMVMPYAGNTSALPDGWLLCDGSTFSRTTYARLFSVIGVTYGAGDGSTTFSVPNLTDKFIEGSSTSGTIKSAGLPNFAGNIYFHGAQSSSNTATVISSVNGVFSGFDNGSNYSASNATSGASSFGGIKFDPSTVNSVYGNSSTVQPPALTMRYIIKF